MEKLRVPLGDQGREVGEPIVRRPGKSVPGQQDSKYAFEFFLPSCFWPLATRAGPLEGSKAVFIRLGAPVSPPVPTATAQEALPSLHPHTCRCLCIHACILCLWITICAFCASSFYPPQGQRSHPLYFVALPTTSSCPSHPPLPPRTSHRALPREVAGHSRR